MLNGDYGSRSILFRDSYGIIAIFNFQLLGDWAIGINLAIRNRVVGGHCIP
jgi:hypothetical protein